MTVFNDPIVKLLGAWAGELNIYSLILRTLLSVALGAVIGSERASKRHAAGLRTFILISFSSAVCMLLDLMLAADHGTKVFLLSGVCLLSVAIISINSILYSSRNQIRGLTTAAGLWASSLSGLLAGAGYYTVTLIAFIALMCGLSFFPKLEIYLKNRSNHFEIHVELTNPVHLQDLVTTMRRLGLVIDDIELNHAYAGSGLSVYTIALSISSPELKKYKTHSEIIDALGTLEYIYHIDEMR